jgi:formate hydrogenlyase transcriptional activator
MKGDDNRFERPTRERLRDVPLQRSLLGVARALAAQLSVEGACSVALDAVKDVFGATSAWIMLQDPQTSALRTVLFRGVGSDVYKDLSIPPSSPSIATRSFNGRQAVFVPDVRAEHGWFDPDKMYRSGLRSLFMLPLVFGPRTLGIIALDAPRFTRTTPPDPYDIEQLEAFAAQLAIAVTNARLYEASEQDRHQLRMLLRERQQLSGQVDQLRREVWEVSSGGLMIGNSTPLIDSVQQAELVSQADTTVLLVGETGTGKDLVARLIHERSRRKNGPFVALNCAALPESLVESELFGHERGAFTGAITRKAGSFEIAHRGTLFLDEIGDLPPEAQAKLLRVLQDRQVRRIGAPKPISVDVRVIAATNQDLEAAIVDKRFRPDLYYRLSVFPIRMPALRDRSEDIPVLADHFLRHFARKLGKPVTGFSVEAVEQMRGYAWPGNVRELQNVIERAVILCHEAVIQSDVLYLPHRPRSAGETAPAAAMAPEHPIPVPAAVARTSRTLADADRLAIVEALNCTRWRISGPNGAAERLGLKPTTLHAKMKKLGIRRPSPAVSMPSGAFHAVSHAENVAVQSERND